MRQILLFVVLITLALFVPTETRSEPLRVFIYERNLTIDSNCGRCFEKKFNFRGGQVQINFDFCISNKFAKSKTLVFLNGQIIQKLNAWDNGKNVSKKIQVRNGTSSLRFCVQSPPKETLHQISILNLVVHRVNNGPLLPRPKPKPVCKPSWSENLIQNGDFESNQCPPHCLWCTYFNSLYQSQIPNWFPNPRIQIARTAFVNKDAWAIVGQSWAMELDPAGNSCSQQKVKDLKKGEYKIKLDWSVTQHIPLASFGFEIKVAGKLIKSFEPKNYGLNREEIDFNLSEGSAEGLVEFCGTGISDYHGVSVDNIQLLRLNDC